MPVFRVTVLETRLYAVDRYVVANDDNQARELAVQNNWSSYDGLADGGEDLADGSIEKCEVDDSEELSAEEVATLKEEWEEDWTHLSHVEREKGPALFFAAVPPDENGHVCDDECRSNGCTARREEAEQDRHLYGI